MPALPLNPAPPSRVARRAAVGWITLGVVLTTLASTSCSNIATHPPPGPAHTVLGTGALLPSPRLIVGRVIAVDRAQHFAFVNLATDAPAAALTPGTELIARTLELRDTGRVQVSPYVRGRTLGTRIVDGQPSPGDEVVWLAP
jgi:hypothetical protein